MQQQQFNCPSCKKPYQQSNLPRLLTMCGHSYCQKCIKSLIVPYHAKGKQYKFKLTCPQDQQHIELVNNKPTQFPKNIALLQNGKKRRSKTMMPSEHRSASGNNISNMSISRIGNTEDLTKSEVDIEGNQFLEMIKSDAKLSSKKILQDFENEDQMQVINDNNICLLHQKQLQIICIDHAERICVNCALFGQHKGHTFKNINEIEKQSQKIRQELHRLIYLKKELETRKSNKTVIKQMNEDLISKTDKMKLDINQFCQQAISRIKEIQKSKLIEVDKLKTSVLNKIKQMDNYKAQPHHQTWQKQAEEMIKYFQQNSIQERVLLLYSKLHMKDTKSIEDLFQEGFCITSQIKQNKPHQLKEIWSLLQSIKVSTSKQTLNKLQNSIEVQSLGPKQQNLFEEVLLHASQSERKIFYPKYQDMSASLCQYEAEQSLLQQSFERDFNPKIEKQYSAKIFKRAEKVSHADLKSSLQSTISQGTKSCFGVNKSLRKKKNTDFLPSYTPKNLNQSSVIRKVSMFKSSNSKFQKTLQGLKLNTLDVIDLTGAELGSEIIQQLGLKYLKNSKAKTVKLIRNKLTDQCLQKLIPNLQNVSVLNISQNELTQKSISLLLQNIQNLPNLKSIVISQNKIAQRKVKAKIEKLKLHGLVVTI